MQDVRFSPSGDHFASVGSDSKIFIYNGAAGEAVAEITNDSHTGSIVGTYNVSFGDMTLTSTGHQTACGWSPDSKTLMTVSADSTVKLCEWIDTRDWGVCFSNREPRGRGREQTGDIMVARPRC